MTFRDLFKPFRKKICFCFILVLITNSLSLALPWGIKLIIDAIVELKDIRLLNSIVCVLICILFLQSFFSFARRKLGHNLAEKIIYDLRERIYCHLSHVSLDNIKKLTPSQILSRMTQDTESIRRFIFEDGIEAAYAFLSLILILFVLLLMNRGLTLIALLILPLFGIFFVAYLPKLKEGYRFSRESTGKLTSFLNEVLNGMPIIRAFTLQDYEKKRFQTLQNKILSLSEKNNTINSGLWTAIEFFTVIGGIAVLWVGGINVMNHKMTLGDLIAFYSYLGMLFSPLLRLVLINSSFQEASAALERINEFISVGGEITKAENPIFLKSLKGGVVFDEVSFSYSKNKVVLDKISFTVNPGEIIGIVGASGVGKTTLTNLILRLMDPLQGKILIDGHDLKQIDVDLYRSRIAAVLQDDYFFNGSIEENIRYGRQESTFEDVVEAAKIACADEFIQSFKDGYQTEMGEQGLNLSSGQRQRIAITRAIIRKPTVLILDEATSSVDAIMENQIQTNIKEFMKGKTIFIVAHRFSTIVGADKIIVLNNGIIAEQGDHNSLLTKKGFYSNLYLEQFKETDRYSFCEKSAEIYENSL